MRSPVLMVIFNRPEVTQQTFEAVRRARPPRLYVAADGPRADRPEEADLCARAREAATAVDWPCEVKTLFRKRNLGCRNGVSSAVTWFFKHEPEGIVLEDDVLPHPDFFPFCDELLERYRDTPEVMQITGSNFQLGARRGDASYYFSHFNHVWGWASWARAWARCDLSMPGYRGFMSRQFSERYDLPPEAADHFLSQFVGIEQGRLESWAYSWQYCHFLHGGLTATPNRALTKNIGFGGGTNCLIPSIWSCVEPEAMPGPLTHPTRLAADDDADRDAFGLVWNPGGTSLKALLELGVRRLNGRQAGANRELLKVARAFYGNNVALDCLEEATARCIVAGE